MVTNYQRHINWGKITSLFYTLWLLKYGFFRLSVGSLAAFKIQTISSFITVVMVYLAGSIQPDLDLEPQPWKLPSVKRTWFILVSGILVLLVNQIVSALYLTNDLHVRLLIGLLCIMVILPWALINSFKLVGLGSHRNSALHSLSLWGSINLLTAWSMTRRGSIFWAYHIGLSLTRNPTLNLQLLYLLYSNSLGVLQHLLLDSAGSITTRKGYTRIRYIRSLVITSMVILLSFYNVHYHLNPTYILVPF